MKFEEGKKYVFDKEIWKKRHPGYAYAYEQAKGKNNSYMSWIDKCNGKLVDVINHRDGTINYDGINYIIDANWCKEVRSDFMKCNKNYCDIHECKDCKNSNSPYSYQCRKCEKDKCQFESKNK